MFITILTIVFLSHSVWCAEVFEPMPIEPADPVSEEELSGTIQGIIKNVNNEMCKFVLVDNNDNEENICFDEKTVFLIKNIEITKPVLKKGMVVTVTYITEYGEEILPGWRSVSYVAKEIKLDILPDKVEPMPILFVDNRDGTITDKKTNLMWQRNYNKEKLSWEEAQRYCRTLTLGGHKNWRLPEPSEYIPNTKLIDHSGNPVDWFWCSNPKVWIPFIRPNNPIGYSNAFGIKEEDRAYVIAVRNILDKPKDKQELSPSAKNEKLNSHRLPNGSNFQTMVLYPHHLKNLKHLKCKRCGRCFTRVISTKEKEEAFCNLSGKYNSFHYALKDKDLEFEFCKECKRCQPGNDWTKN